jgi:hypothetical protein
VKRLKIYRSYADKKRGLPRRPWRILRLRWRISHPIAAPNRVTMLDLLALQFSTQTHGQLFGETPANYS